VFDVIVVGGGPAGLSAALMLGRCRRRVLVCDAGEPRNRRAAALHGYLTRDGTPPIEFNGLGRRELAEYSVEFRPGVVERAHREPEGFRVSLANGGEETGRYLLLATGVIDEPPKVQGIDACYGRSVFHCPYCDGWEWRDRRLAVVGDGTSGVALASSLKTWSDSVTLCTNEGSVGRGGRAQLARLGVAVRAERIDHLEHDDGYLSCIVLAGGELACDALFFVTRQHPRNALAAALGCRFTRHGTVVTGTLSETNVDGVFVAGDASRDAQFVVVAAAEGTKAALAINQALQRRERET
jgi:thioredoxin reductase